MPDQAIRVSFLDQRVMQPRWQGAVGECREGARERGFAWHFAGALPAARAAQGLVGRQHVDQQAGGWQVERRLGNEAAGQGRALGGRTPDKPVPAWQERLDPSQAEHADEVPMTRRQRTVHRIVKPGQKFSLNMEPVWDSIAFSDIACILVVFVGIWSFCNSIIPRNGCRRLAKSTHSEAQNHADSVILQVALWSQNSVSCLPSFLSRLIMAASVEIDDGEGTAMARN